MGIYKIEDYFLDINSMTELTPNMQEMVNYNYNILLNHEVGNNSKLSIFNTLINSGYLKSVVVEERDKKITSILS